MRGRQASHDEEWENSLDMKKWPVHGSLVRIIWDDDCYGMQVGINGWPNDTRREQNGVWAGLRQILTWRFFKVQRRGKRGTKSVSAWYWVCFCTRWLIDTYLFLTKLHTIHHRVGSVLCHSLVGFIKPHVKEHFFGIAKRKTQTGWTQLTFAVYHHVAQSQQNSQLHLST